MFGTGSIHRIPAQTDTMTDISLTKTVVVLAASPADHSTTTHELTQRLRAHGRNPVRVGRAGPAEPELDRLRRADWSTAVDSVLDACTKERDARRTAAAGDVLVVGGSPIGALAWYQAGLSLRGERCDPRIRGWLEGPTVGAAAHYGAVLHVRPASGAGRAVTLVDEALLAVLERLGIPTFAIFASPSDCELGHTLDGLFASPGHPAVPTSSAARCLTGWP
ncbi:hypothetical protein GCM10010174_08050 [Kutzneria viridogrisea]